MKWFKLEEFDCKCGCGLNNISQALLGRLDAARDDAMVPFVVTSACRCEEHNRAVGGSPTSSHLTGLAVDIRTPDSFTRFRVTKALFNRAFTRIFIYETFIHVDIDNTKPTSLLGVLP